MNPNDNNAPKKGLSNGAIFGIIGGVIGVIVVAGVGFWIWKYKPCRREKEIYI